jgi:hypothetical protein
MFDVPHMQNSLRGLWVEAMVCEILGSGWKHTGNDWAAWDLERSDGLRVEVKQSARQQSWGTSTSLPRYSIAAAKGHYPDGKTYVDNASATRLTGPWPPYQMLQCGPSLRTLVHLAVFLLAETSVCGLSANSLHSH